MQLLHLWRYIYGDKEAAEKSIQMLDATGSILVSEKLGLA